MINFVRSLCAAGIMFLVSVGLADSSIFIVDDAFLHKAPSAKGFVMKVFASPSVVLLLTYHNAFENLLFAASQTEVCHFVTNIFFSKHIYYF